MSRSASAKTGSKRIDARGCSIGLLEVSQRQLKFNTAIDLMPIAWQHPVMSLKNRSITRRRFLANSTKAVSTLAAANLLLRPNRVSGEPRRLSPNEKLNIAFIGVAGRGGNNLGELTGAE